MSTPPAAFPSKLQGKRVLVLGGTSGIGFAVASGALAAGAAVHVSSSQPEKVTGAVDRLRAAYPAAAAAVAGTPANLADLDTQESALRAVLDAAVAALGGPLHHVVFTAGELRAPTPLADLTPAEAARAGAVWFYAPLTLAKLLAQSPGRWVATESASSLTLTGGVNTARPRRGTALFTAYGAALEGLARGLSVDLAPVRVNLISLGVVYTERLAGLSEAALEAYRGMTLAYELGRPEDVAEAYLYCMRDRFVVGKTIETDGGRLLV